MFGRLISVLKKGSARFGGTMRRSGLLVLVLVCVTMAQAWAEAGDPIAELVLKAGNADTDEARLVCLKELRQLPDLDEGLATDVNRLIEQVERWINDPRLAYFGQQVLKTDNYDFGIDKDSPLYPITRLYQVRMLVWVTVEYGGYWSDPESRRKQFDKIRPIFEEVAKAFPENRLIRMYLGEPIPPRTDYPAVAGAPEWAVHQREGLERLADIITWWVDHRMRDNGEYGGGWGDDCEMWRWWVPVLIAFDDPKIVQAQARFSNALLSQEHMKDGYTSHVYDVQHTAEDSSDAMTPMMHLEPDNDVWRARALRLAELMETVWTGTNERGQLQFKSTYFGATKVDASAKRACDTVYHPRAVAPALVLWQRTGDARLGKLFTAWMDTWVDVTARAERGKPAGIIPSAIHWPDGGIGGIGERWWDPENHTKDPLYVWPSAMSMLTNTLLLTYHMTQNEKYIEPLRSMAAARLGYLKNRPKDTPAQGSEAWCASKMGGLSGVLGKYRLLTGNTEFDELLARDAGPYVAYRLSGEKRRLAEALEHTAAALRVNFEGYTSEVRYTDRVLRFPAILGENGMFLEAVPGIRRPDPGLLYAAATGDPGSPSYFPLNAVRWRTPPRDIAALVTETGRDHFAAELFHFGSDPRPMEADLYLLEAGDYVMTLVADGQELARETLQVGGPRTAIRFELPARQLCALRVQATR